MQNKKESGDTDAVLSLQGIGWLTRKAIGMAGITQHLKQYPDADDASITHIDFDQVVTGGLKGTTELRTLDWQYRPHSDQIFGSLKGRSRFNKVAALGEAVKEVRGGDEEDAKFLAEGWDEETLAGEIVEAYVESDDNGWVGVQAWGFATVTIGGKEERRHVRNVVVKKGKNVKRIRLVFDWVA
jgi:hypothetical protein